MKASLPPAATSTIVIGAIEERMRFEAYVAYNALLLCWVYPLVVVRRCLPPRTPSPP